MAAKTTMLEPASGRPKRSSARARARSNPGRTAPGSKAMKSTAPAAAPASCPIARLIAPSPARAQAIEVSALTQVVTWSATILWPCRNLRCSMPTGVATRPLMIR